MREAYDPTAAPPAFAARFNRIAQQPALRHLSLAILGFAFVLLISFNVSTTSNDTIQLVACYAAVIGGLSVLTGISGQVSLGNGAFMAVGAYATAIWMIHHPSQSFLVALLFGTVCGALFGFILGLPATQLRGPYLAGMTLAFAAALPQIIQYQPWNSWFGGDSGLSVSNQPQPPQWLIDHSQAVDARPMALASARWLAWIAVAFALLVLFVLANLLSSRFGRQFRAVRDDDVAAELMGINVARTRVIAFTVSAACAGLGGGLFTITQGTFYPSQFQITLSILLVAAMVLGGAGTLMGAVWGALLYGTSSTWVQSLASTIHVNPTSAVGANLQYAIFGVLLIVAIMVAPGGIQRLLLTGYHHLRRRFAR